MICKNCQEDAAVSTKDGKLFVCTSCGASWQQKGKESVWDSQARDALKKELRDELLEELSKKPEVKEGAGGDKVDWDEKDAGKTAK